MESQNISLFKEKIYRHIRAKLDFRAVMSKYYYEYWEAYEVLAPVIKTQSDFIDYLVHELNLKLS